MNGNFLGSAPIPISHSVALPPHVRNITMSFGDSRGSLMDVARNIRTATGLAVDVALTLLPRVALRAVRSDRTALKGFLEARRQLAAVRRSRAAATARARRSDAEVLRRFRELEASAVAGGEG